MLLGKHLNQKGKSNQSVNFLTIKALDWKNNVKTSVQHSYQQQPEISGTKELPKLPNTSQNYLDSPLLQYYQTQDK